MKTFIKLQLGIHGYWVARATLALEAIFVEQRFGPSPPKGQGVDRSKRADFSDTWATKKKDVKMSVLLWAPWRGPVALGSSGGNLC